MYVTSAQASSSTNITNSQDIVVKCYAKCYLVRVRPSSTARGAGIRYVPCWRESVQSRWCVCMRLGCIELCQDHSTSGEIRGHELCTSVADDDAKGDVRCTSMTMV